MIKNLDHRNVIHYGENSLLVVSRNDSDTKVCLKILKEEYPSPEVMAQFEREYEFCADPASSSIRKAFNKSSFDNHHVIAFEYIEGIDLKKHLDKTEFSIEERLHLALKMAHALSAIHTHNIFHGQINPSNILIQKDTGNIYIIDFGAAAHINGFNTEQVQKITDLKSLVYSSPEQTGRINRNIDARSDLYSLGVILYQLFTGATPFNSTDSSELIYGHIAQTPVTPVLINTDIPVVISEMIMKLLAKNAEDRYQSAFGVKHDIEKCISLLDENQSIISFPIATVDYSGKFYVQQKLYGRDKEINLLFNIFDQCASGEKKLLVVSGYSGSGKSALISEIQKPITQKHGLFIRGKFDQMRSDTPYSAFIEAFSELTQFILVEEYPEQVKWKKRIAESLGSSGKVLSDLVPGLEKLMGKQSEIAELTGAEASNRFNYILLNFLKATSNKDQPLVICIDDLQWADASSLNLIKVIMNDKESGHLMVIGSYRKNEVDHNHSLMKLLTSFKETAIDYNEMELTDLSKDDVYTLVGDLLRTKQDNSHHLAEVVYEKTKGNAFYVHQFLKSIYEEQFLKFDFSTLQWTWNREMILQMNVSGNVVDLMASLIQKMPPETIDILKNAACIGNRFEKRSLAMFKEISEKEVERLLHNPLSDGLIITTGSSYKFAHDRIQQAIYFLIPDEEKKQIHLKIGKSLSAMNAVNELSEKIFDIVNQWNIAIELVQDEKTRLYLANLNLMAAHKAISSAAYPQALVYLEKSLQLINNGWQSHYELMLKVTGEAAEAAYYCGEYGKVDAYVNELINQSSSLIDSIKGYEVRIKKLIAQNQLLEAITVGLHILHKMHIRIPIKPGKLRTLVGLLRTKWSLRNKNHDRLTALPPMKEREKHAEMRLLADISSASYFAAPELVPLLIFKMVRLTVRHGLSRKSPYSFSAYGFILSAYMGEIDHGISYGQIAVTLAKKLKADELYGSIMTTNNLFLTHWRKPLHNTIQDLDDAFKSSLESGDTEWASYSAHNMTYQLFIMGYPLHELEKKMESLDIRVEKFRHELIIKRMRVFRQTVINLITDTPDPVVLKGEVFDESWIDIDKMSDNNKVYFQNLFFQKMYLALIFNKSELAYEYAQTVATVIESTRGSAIYPLFYFYDSLAITGLYDGTKASLKRINLKTLRKNIVQLKKFEKLCPENYSYKRILVEAEYNQVKGNNAAAKLLYDDALKAASEQNILHDLALSWERAAQFFIHTKQDLLARFYLQNAYRSYQKWGATTKITQMMKNYPLLENSSRYELESDIINDLDKPRGGDVDLATVIKASSALSGEIVLSRLLKKLMQIILENAGAQNGYLILEKNEERFIEAEISVDKEGVTTMQSIPVNDSGLLAESIVNYVSLTREVVMLDDASQDHLFGNDEYVKDRHSKSILCVPLVNQGKLQAIIYLSNDLISGAFTEKRLALLKLLSGQMAISIENALFYSDLENKVNQRTYELQLEKKKSDDLLLNILPEEIANELKLTGRTKPRSYQMATVMFTDFKDFTIESEKLSPQELVTIVDTCFRKFDQIISKYKIEKIKTIGDAYLCVSGLPNPDDHNACDVVKAALEIKQFIESLKAENQLTGPQYFDIRIGIHSGPLVAGVVGERKFAYDIWGDTVNTAARMEQNSSSNKINISQATFDLISDKFHCTGRGKQPAKNKGLIEMYFVESEVSPVISGDTELLIAHN